VIRLPAAAGSHRPCLAVDQRLSLRPPNDAEPLPSAIYMLALHLAMSPERPPGPARLRPQAADGRWAVARARRSAAGSGAAAGYAVTLERAPVEDLAPLLTRAWGLTAREREVARLVMDGLSTGDIAASLYISGHTVGHVKPVVQGGSCMSEDLFRVDHTADADLGDEPPDRCPLRPLAERTELADAVSGLSEQAKSRSPIVFLPRWCHPERVNPNRTICTLTPGSHRRRAISRYPADEGSTARPAQLHCGGYLCLSGPWGGAGSVRCLGGSS
jgi:hypothetical protein